MSADGQNTAAQLAPPTLDAWGTEAINENYGAFAALCEQDSAYDPAAHLTSVFAEFGQDAPILTEAPTVGLEPGADEGSNRILDLAGGMLAAVEHETAVGTPSEGVSQVPVVAVAVEGCAEAALDSRVLLELSPSGDPANHLDVGDDQSVARQLVETLRSANGPPGGGGEIGGLLGKPIHPCPRI